MKKIIIAFVFISAAAIFSAPASAQVRVNINIGDQPDWGPSGYDYAEYYYLPDIESYYCVPRRQFVYLSDGRWIFASNLPSRYAGYDLYSGYKVVLNYRDAYQYFNEHRQRYSGYRNYYDRQPVRHDNGNHYGWYKNKGNDNRGRGNGNWNGNGGYNRDRDNNDRGRDNGYSRGRDNDDRERGNGRGEGNGNGRGRGRGRG